MDFIAIKVKQSGKQIMFSSILPKNERNSLSWVEKMLRFWDLLTFGIENVQANQFYLNLFTLYIS